MMPPTHKVKLKAAAASFGGALLFTSGLLLMGADGAWFPWKNLVGVVIFAGLIPYVKLLQRPAPRR